MLKAIMIDQAHVDFVALHRRRRRQMLLLAVREQLPSAPIVVPEPGPTRYRCRTYTAISIQTNGTLPPRVFPSGR